VEKTYKLIWKCPEKKDRGIEIERINKSSWCFAIYLKTLGRIKVETKKVASTKKISKLAEKPTEKHSEKQILESKDSKESRIPTVNDESCNVKNTDISFVKQDGESQVVKPTNSFKIAEGLLSAPKYQDYSAFDTEK